MKDVLSGARILVADDQPDAAKAFTSVLKAAGARIQFANDGESAYKALQADPFDLLLVDMKMPPEEWGGLWLLEWLAQSPVRVPILVLSGEGGRTQVVEALDLGAKGWVDKDAAGEKLLRKCVSVLADSDAAALQNAADQLPTPIAFRIARYLRATTLDMQVTEGNLAIEAILRFAACVGMATTEPATVPGLKAERLNRPSMGTWRDIAFALAKRPDAGSAARRLVQALAPDTPTKSTVSSLVTMRNKIVHGDDTAKPSDKTTIDALLRRFAHRATTNFRVELAVATSMRFDGAAFVVDTQVMRGTAVPQPATCKSKEAVVDGTMLLIDDGQPFDLTPLLASTTSSSGVLRCVQFDGLDNGSGPDPVVRYGRCHEGDDALPSLPSKTWPDLAAWTVTRTPL